MTWFLFLSHFLADYPLQPNWMARNKRRPYVMVGHVSIHFLVLLLLAGESRRVIWPFLLALTLAHLCIDIGKETVYWLRPDWVVGPYVIDQCFHYITIVLTGIWIGSVVGPVNLPFSAETAILAATYLVATYVWFISERIFTHADLGYLAEVQAQLWSRMATRAVMLSAMLGLLLWIMPSGSPFALSPALAWTSGWTVSIVAGPSDQTVGLVILASAVASLPYFSGQYRQRALLTDVFVSLVLAVLSMIALIWLS